MIEINCPCGESYHAEDSHRGQRLKCRKCGTILTIERQAQTLTDSPALPDEEPNESPWASIGAWSKITRRRRRLTIVACFVAVGCIVALAWWLTTVRPDMATLNAVARSYQPARPTVPLPPCAQNHSAVRPETGERIEPDEGLTGYSRLSIENNSDADAVVNVVRESDGASVRAVYVRNGDSYTLHRIEPGSYDLRWETGREWVSACDAFLDDPEDWRFDRGITTKQSKDYALG